MLKLRRSARAVLMLAAVVALSTAAARSADACPLCMNSDPALNNPGSTNSSAGQWRVTVENKSLSKLNGIVQNGVPRGSDHEFQHEDRLAATLAYQANMRLGVALTVPFMFRSHTQYTTLGNSQTKASNFSDADLTGRYAFWIRHTPGHYASATAVGAVVAPTGANSVLFPGGTVRLSEHNQPGTGSWAVMGGVALQVQNSDRWAYLGAVYKKLWANKYDYEYRHANMLTLELGQKASSKLAVLGTAVYRSTATEVANDPATTIYQVQTGGDILLVGGGVQATPMQHISLRGVAYFPVVNGFRQPQSEDNSLSFMVSYIK